MYEVTKVFSGYSTVYRQWRARSHCRFLHGYALKFKVTFGCMELDENGWVVDFGGFDAAKYWLRSVFDHTVICSIDDPMALCFKQLQSMHDVANVVILKDVGCEAFAENVSDFFKDYIKNHIGSRVHVVSVECIENENNSAIYKP